MKYVKTYEAAFRPFKVGDYVICDYKNTSGNKEKIIGRIEEFLTHTWTHVKFEKFSDSVMNFNILYWADNKEDLETILQAEKYNL